jgi:hypothetical protein
MESSGGHLNWPARGEAIEGRSRGGEVDHPRESRRRGGQRGLRQSTRRGLDTALADQFMGMYANDVAVELEFMK